MLAKGWHFLNFIPIVDWEKRLELLAVIHFIFLWILLPIFAIWVPFYVLFTRYWWIMVAYMAWTWYSRHAPQQGSYGGLSWYKSHPIWRHFANYFPIKLVKTTNLSPDRNYIIGSHPHGVLSIGAFTNMVTDGTGFSKQFPGLKSTVLTLNGQFYFPFRRDVGMALGGVEASKESLTYLLKNPGKGRAVAIVIGGATEMLDAHSGCYDINIMARRGFCRYAIMHGADLVPMYNFGENDVYEQIDNPRGSLLRNIQQRIKNMFGFCPPLFSGCGIFTTFGLLPFRKPITSVVGAPIRVVKNICPTDEEIDSLHAKYCEALVNLFEDYKHLHKIPAEQHLHLY